MTYIILLPLQFLIEIKLLGLQTHQRLPQLIGFLPIKIITSHTHQASAKLLRSSVLRGLHSCNVLEFILTQMVYTQRLPAFSQDLLLLLPLSLFLAFSVVTLFGKTSKWNSTYRYSQ